MSSRDIAREKKIDANDDISRGPLSGSPPFGDADCSVYNSSERSSGSLGGAAARSTTASCPEPQTDRAVDGIKSRGSERPKVTGGILDLLQWKTEEESGSKFPVCSLMFRGS